MTSLVNKTKVYGQWRRVGEPARSNQRFVHSVVPKIIWSINNSNCILFPFSIRVQICYNFRFLSSVTSHVAKMKFSDSKKTKNKSCKLVVEFDEKKRSYV